MRSAASSPRSGGSRSARGRAARAQPGVGYTRRSRPSVSEIRPRSSRREESSMSILSSPSRTWTAVVGSLTAGESARRAMSTIARIANAGSCVIVRSSATIAARRSSRSSRSSTGPRTMNSGAPCGTYSPTPIATSTTAPLSAAARTSRARSRAERTPEPPAWETTAVTGASAIASTVGASPSGKG